MSIPMFTQVRVVSKFINVKDDKEYCNLKVADINTFDSQIISVNRELYDIAEEGKDIKLQGKLGGLKDKYWYFNGTF